MQYLELLLKERIGDKKSTIYVLYDITYIVRTKIAIKVSLHKSGLARLKAQGKKLGRPA